MIELTITVKDENSKLVEKEVIFDSFLLDPGSTFLTKKAKSALDKFNADPSAEAPDIIIKATMRMQ